MTMKPLLGLVLTLGALAGILPAQVESTTPDVIWIMVDSLSPDLLPAMGGNAEAQTPVLEGLARRGAVFGQTWSVSPQRLTGLIAQLWSQNPDVIENSGGTEATPGAASQFEDRGFRVTGCFTKNLLNAQGEPLGRFLPALGFPSRGWEYGSSEEKIVNRIKLVAEANRNEHLFTFVHLANLDPPSRVHPGITTPAGPGGHWRAALEYVDGAIGRILEVLDKAKRLESTVVVFSSSRGLAELPGDEPLRRDRLDAKGLRIPLIIAGPGIAPGRHDDLLRSTDILPTLLDYLGLPAEYSLQGRSFAPLLRGEKLKTPRTVFAEHLPFAGEAPDGRRMMVGDGRWRLLHLPLAAVDRLQTLDGEETEDLSDSQPEVARALADRLENEQIANLACSRLWSVGEQRAPDLEGPEGLIYKGRLLVERRDPAARETVVSLMKDGRADPLESLSLLIACGQKEDVAIVEPLLVHKDARVQAMAGAFLSLNGEVTKGVDRAVQGLRDDMPPARLYELLAALGRSGSDLARKAVERFQPREAVDGVNAYRDLALARLGDEGARNRLPRHLLNIHGGYPVRPFLDALIDLDHPHLQVILSLFLETTEVNADDALKALATLEKLKFDGAAAAVSTQTQHPEPRVRKAALRLLTTWGSARAAAAAIETPVDPKAGLAPRLPGLLAEPGLLGSPVLPGLRFDMWTERNGADQPSQGGLPLISDRFLDLRLALEGAIFERAVLAFRVLEGPASPDALRLIFRLNEVEKPLRTLEFLKQGDLFWWVGEIPAGAIEPGTNRIRMRLQQSEKGAFKAVADTFFLMPAPGRKLTPVVGLDARKNRLTVSTPVVRDARLHRISCIATGADGGLLVVSSGETTLLKVELKSAWPGLLRDLTLPTPLARDARIRLDFEGLPAGANAQALLFTVD